MIPDLITHSIATLYTSKRSWSKVLIAKPLLRERVRLAGHDELVQLELGPLHLPSGSRSMRHENGSRRVIPDPSAPIPGTDRGDHRDKGGAPRYRSSRSPGSKRCSDVARRSCLGHRAAFTGAAAAFPGRSPPDHRRSRPGLGQGTPAGKAIPDVRRPLWSPEATRPYSRQRWSHISGWRSGSSAGIRTASDRRSGLVAA